MYEEFSEMIWCTAEAYVDGIEEMEADEQEEVLDDLLGMFLGRAEEMGYYIDPKTCRVELSREKAEEVLDEIKDALDDDKDRERKAWEIIGDFHLEFELMAEKMGYDANLETGRVKLGSYRAEEALGEVEHSLDIEGWGYED